MRVAALRALRVVLLLLAGCRSYDVPPITDGTFAVCCGGLGTCVAAGLVAPEQRESLAQDSCNESLLCAPTELVARGTLTPVHCTVQATLAEGRCLPGCLPQVATQPGLRQDDCADGRLCAPCFDPFTGASTHACTLGHDVGPTQPAVTFSACCGSLGRCVPSTLVEQKDRQRLAQAECTDGQNLCVPEPLARGTSWTAQACRDEATGAEGRCLPGCLPEVRKRASKLTRGACSEDHLCAPCYDPNTGEGTGACELGGDRGPTEPPHVFASCCGALGRCVPTSLVSPDDRPRVGRDSCANSTDSCVPAALAQDDAARFAHCTDSATQAEARCLPACLPDVADRAAHLRRESCAADELCAACFDPITGKDTGACTLGGDPGPTRPAVVFAPCCGELGRCAPKALIAASDHKRLAQDTCANHDDLCVPEGLARSDSYVPLSCVMHLTHAEGRCLPACVPEVGARADVLAQDGCPSGNLCTPCFDPTDGRNTGACNLGGDPGPARAPTLFANCCGDLGRCVPQPFIPEADSGRLARDTCSASSDQCLPQPLLLDPDYTFAHCSARATGAEGRCLPACLPEVAQRASELGAQTCESGLLCAPCFDPFDGTSTGACTLGGDPGPTTAPMPFGACCGDLGRCVPQELLSPEERPHLGRDSCASASDLCAPDALARDPDYVFASCDVSATGAEGRCLPACLPEVAARGAELRQDGCETGHVCSPCFDPIDGQQTGACTLGADPGPRRPATVFANCCGDLGRCVPSTLVSEAERSHVAQDGCASAGNLCVPEPLARTDKYVFPTCSVVTTGAEGRCLPACLPEVAARAADLSQDGCATGSLCSPCYDPFDGTATGACNIGGDPGPVHPATVFARCCGELGRCIPSASVPTDERQRLGRDSCTSASDLCVPEPLAKNQSYVFPSCNVSATSAEGRCLPACLPDVSANASQLRQDGCTSGTLCTPCFEPLDGTSTSACTLGGDPGPTRPAVVFSSCCGGASRCIARDLVPSEELSHLGPDSCSGAQELCVPDPLARNPDYVFASCVVGQTGAEGRCLPQCLPEVAARASELQQDGCSSGQLCTPCYEPLDGNSTGACSIGGDPGPAAPPTTYAHCCSDGGRCIPSAQVPADERSKLSADSCTGAAAPLCVPLSQAHSPDAPPASCHDSATNAEGRCLMQCLPSVAAQASRLRQSGCGQAELCVPCYDPISGAASGACTFSASDPGPQEPPVTFADCCAGGGLCVPSSLLPGGSSNLPQQSCTGSGYVCAPRALVVDPNTSLPSCTSILGPSACLNSCFVGASVSSILPVGGCAADERCVPCWAATGVCR